MAYKQPLREGSQLKGRCEAGFWRPLGKDRFKVLDAFRAYQLAHRKRGERFGPGGALGERILRYLVAVTGKDGRCDPTYKTIADRCKCCVSAVVATVKRLAQLGFLRWLRRYAPIASPDAWGPQVHQTSNAYRVEIPAAAAAILKSAKPETPDDFEAEKSAKATQLRQYENDASGLTAALDRLGAGIERRQQKIFE